MKFNKWTLGLAAVGAVSLASAVRADEAPKMSQLQTALSNTTISGYVDVAAQYNTGNQSILSGVPAGTGNSAFSSAAKIDAFSLNDVDVAIDHPEDDTPWASGYHVDLNWGSDAINGLAGFGGNVLGAAESSIGADKPVNIENAIQSGQNFGVRQAYIVIRTPVGNGIDWKVGVQDDIIGYEGNTDGAQPNYTRSVGYFLEPTTLTGLVGTYAINKVITVQSGIADATSGDSTLSTKSYVAAVALTAPSNWGWASGSTLNAGTVLNLEKFGQCNYYAGFSLNTPISMLTVGGSFDLASVADEGSFGANPHNDSGWVLGGYVHLQPTDKLAFNARAEYYDLQAGVSPYGDTDGRGEELTFTASYSLWANVVSRVEFRWDHADEGLAYGGATDFGIGGPGPSYANSFILAANLIYTF